MSLILYTAPTPDGYQVSITLEELGLPYEVRTLDLARGEQKGADYLAINPNGKVPALVDDGFPIMESGAILIWLAEKAGQLLPTEPRARSRVLQWLMFQVGGVGPMMGQANLWHRFHPDRIAEPISRYQGEVRRLLAVLDGQLGTRQWLADEYSIADIATWCWVRTADWSGVALADFGNVMRWKQEIAARPAVQRGLMVPEASPNRSDAPDSRAFVDRTRRLMGLAPREA